MRLTHIIRRIAAAALFAALNCPLALAQQAAPTVSIGQGGNTVGVAPANTAPNNAQPDLVVGIRPDTISALSLPDNSAFTFGSSGQTAGSAINCIYQTASTSNPLTAGNQGTAQCTHYRALMAAPVDSGGGDMTDSTLHALHIEGVSGGVTLPVQATDNITQFGGTNISTGTGAGGVGIPRVTISNDSSLAANQSTNEAEINGTAVVTGTGVATGAQRTTVAQDTTTVAGSPSIPAGTNAIGTVQPGNTQNTTPWLVSQGCANATPANTLTKPFSNAASASNLLLVTGVASQKVHICHIFVDPVFGAVNIALVEGTTTTNPCDTGTAGLLGGATAATGASLLANEGYNQGNGVGIIAQEATNANNVCMLFSAAVQVSGVLTYAIY